MSNKMNTAEAAAMTAHYGCNNLDQMVARITVAAMLTALDEMCDHPDKIPATWEDGEWLSAHIRKVVLMPPKEIEGLEIHSKWLIKETFMNYFA